MEKVNDEPQQNNEGLGRKIANNLAKHIVDTTAILSSTNPIYSAMEVGISGMPDEVSIGSRWTVAALSYGGMALAYAKGRELSRKAFSITDRTKERFQTLHDFAYTAAFNLAVAPPIYLSMGANLKQAAIGGLTAAAFSTVMGPVMGYSIDVAEDLVGLRECNRPSYPRFVKKQKPLVKKGLAGLLVAGSIAAMAGIYALTPDKQTQSLEQPPAITQTVDSSSE